MIEPVIAVDNNIHSMDEGIVFHCVMLLGKNYLSYCLCSDDFTIVYHLSHFNKEDTALTKSDLLAVLDHQHIKRAKRIMVALDSFKSVLCPFDLYSEDAKMTYFNFLEEKLPDEEVHTHNITDSIVDLYSIKNSTHVLLSGMTHNVNFMSASAVLLRNYPSQITNNAQHTVFISLKEDLIVLTLYTGNQLQYHRVIQYQTEYDILYHMANLLRVKNIEASETEIKIHSEQSKLDMVVSLLQRHYSKIKMCTRLPGIHYPDGLYNQPAHYFFNLFSVLGCA